MSKHEFDRNVPRTKAGKKIRRRMLLYIKLRHKYAAKMVSNPRHMHYKEVVDSERPVNPKYLIGDRV